MNLKFSLNRCPLLKVHHWAIILRFFVLDVFMCGPVFCPCLSVSVYVRLCLVCALCLFVFIVFTHGGKFAGVGKCNVNNYVWELFPLGGLHNLVAKSTVSTFCTQAFAGIRNWFVKGGPVQSKDEKLQKNVQSVTHHILYTCPLSLSASPLQPFHAIRLDYPRGPSHSTWWQKPIAKNVDIFTVHFQYLRV